ncbi:hypothetical protein [Dactylosporangium sp. NPDC051541]|uniref:hypothetical protein n=1 Tax=Dactylosporangium sp. NPDC051541 TaxID=3363977 RepID=UPI0037BB5E45
MTNHEDVPPATPETVPQLVTTLCGSGTCPTVYRTRHDTVLVQGAVATGMTVGDGEQVVEIPRELLLEAARLLRQETV